jgi:hypothetical protein
VVGVVVHNRIFFGRELAIDLKDIAIAFAPLLKKWPSSYKEHISHLLKRGKLPNLSRPSSVNYDHFD